jgi:hypothetical protein
MGLEHEVAGEVRKLVQLGLTCTFGFVERLVDVAVSGTIRSLGDGHGRTSHVEVARTRERERAGWAHACALG